MDSYNPAKKQRSSQQKLILATVAVLGLSLAFWVFSWFRGSEVTSPAFVTKAAVILAGESSVSGTVIFEQTAIGLPVTVKGDLKGLDPNSLRGFHVHQFGDLTNGCLSTGSHYNPFGRAHGSPSDTTNRHVGDLGNIEADKDGHATFNFQDPQISLNGPLSILGRAVVVHAGTDDLGKGGNDESLKTGNAGGRAACGVIGISS